jgi:Undecaprenyl-phosphate glucose phosphotransferase
VVTAVDVKLRKALSVTWKFYSPAALLSRANSDGFDRGNQDRAKNRAQGQQVSLSLSLLTEVQAVLLPLGIVLAALAAKELYFNIASVSPSPVSFYMGAGILASIIWSIIATQSGVLSASSIIEGGLRLRAIVTSVSLCFAFLLLLFYMLKMSDYVSRGWFLLWYGFSISFLILERYGILLWTRPQKAESPLVERVAVYGSANLAERVIDSLIATNRNLALAGVFSDEPPEAELRVPIAGGMPALIANAQRGACDRVVLALPWGAEDKIRNAIASLDVLPIAVQLSPDAMTVPGFLANSHEEGGLVLLDLQRPPLSARETIVKWAMDYLIGGVALITFAPLMAAIAIAIKFDSPGPVFFIQSRHGYNHRIIRVFKFRTMTVAENGPVVRQAVRGDKRVTRVGRFLRSTSLDELPQLFNVMTGELSLVGPRPHAVAHNEAYSRMLSRYASRHKVKPGITGWAQVSGFRGETQTPDAMRQRVDFDLYYIKNWSPWMDIKILTKTVLVPFRRANAY